MSSIDEDLIAQIAGSHPPTKVTTPGRTEASPPSLTTGTQPPNLHLKDLSLRTLNMLHFMSLEIDFIQPPGFRIFSFPEDRFKDDSAIYNHGGQVMRIFFPTTRLQEDCMVCDTSVCVQCNPSANAVGVGSNPPCVHFPRDCSTTDGWEPGMFQPQLEQWPYDFDPLDRRTETQIGTHAPTRLLFIQNRSSPTSQDLLSTMSGRWWIEERILLHILFTESDLTLDQTHDIFGRFFGEALREEGRPKYAAASLHSEFNGRWLDGRPQSWNDIEKPNVEFGNVNNLTQQEQDERTRVREDIVIVGADVGVTNWLREDAAGNIVPPNGSIVLNPRVPIFRPTMSTAAEVAVAAKRFPGMHR
ncbi:hypothetical protein TI39_contig491g00013 [Zymoseptoria brevis]|uniref:Uncharacterized protein n=1 Tax=Zymoseptoria brevis TaxID=1047168 RepID=A0A0F4GMM3_9PEZI|nr:hypothetical protein TI39_contig491g00013 [Zymoseptoria brevis]